jgi:hypothetical protein
MMRSQVEMSRHLLAVVTFRPMTFYLLKFRVKPWVGSKKYSHNYSIGTSVLFEGVIGIC